MHRVYGKTEIIFSFFVIFLFILFNIDEIKSFAKNFDISTGIASGDVTSDSIIIWSKTNNTALMHLTYYSEFDLDNSTYKNTLVNSSSEFTGHIKINNLKHNTTYYYNIWFSDPYSPSILSEVMEGKFRTAPLKENQQNITFAVGGDLGGQGYCKKVYTGYDIFSIIKELNPNFFVANGDMIYADDVCKLIGPIEGWRNIPGSFPSILDKSVNWDNISEVKSVYSEHWKYNKEDKHYQNLYGNIPVYSQPDDHEIANNYDGASNYYNEDYKNRTGFKNLVKQGLEAFFNYSPIESFKDDPTRIYRSFNWGKYLDIFILDSHQYRNDSSIPESSFPNKTLLGTNQMEWLKKSLESSNAIWKIILNDVPITIPHCSHDNQFDVDRCDNWATDNVSAGTYTKERNEFLTYLDAIDMKNFVFLVTDAHYPANILINHDFDGDGDNLKFYELVNGPLSAIPLVPEKLDPTINASYVYKDNGFFNFGYYKLVKGDDNKTHFISQIVTGDGLIKLDSKLDIFEE